MLSNICQRQCPDLSPRGRYLTVLVYNLRPIPAPLIAHPSTLAQTFARLIANLAADIPRSATHPYLIQRHRVRRSRDKQPTVRLIPPALSLGLLRVPFLCFLPRALLPVDPVDLHCTLQSANKSLLLPAGFTATTHTTLHRQSTANPYRSYTPAQTRHKIFHCQPHLLILPFSPWLPRQSPPTKSSTSTT